MNFKVHFLKLILSKYRSLCWLLRSTLILFIGLFHFGTLCRLLRFTRIGFLSQFHHVFRIFSRPSDSLSNSSGAPSKSDNHLSVHHFRCHPRPYVSDRLKLLLPAFQSHPQQQNWRKEEDRQVDASACLRRNVSTKMC